MKKIHDSLAVDSEKKSLLFWDEGVGHERGVSIYFGEEEVSCYNDIIGDSLVGVRKWMNVLATG